MKSTLYKDLQSARAIVEKLEKAYRSQQSAALSSLHREHGFDDVEEFIKALRDADRGPVTRRVVLAARKTEKGAKAQRRATITPEIKQKVKESVLAGKTGAAIAKEQDISLPSVQNIKRELGLVKKR